MRNLKYAGNLIYCTENSDVYRARLDSGSSFFFFLVLFFFFSPSPFVTFVVGGGFSIPVRIGPV